MRGRGGARDGWPEGGYNRRKKDNLPITTFFVTNLPGGVSNTLLWKAFQPYGRVNDAYVARKRDSRGNFFGFVRYEGVKDVKEALYYMNTVKIFEAKVNVSLARFNKQHEKIEHRSEPGGQANNYGGAKNTPPNFQYVPINHSLRPSYKEAVIGRMDRQESSKKVLKLENRGSLYSSHCMMRAVIGVAKKLEAFGSINKMLMNGGYMETPVGYLGGLTFKLVFRDKTTAMEFINRRNELWEQVFESTELWTGQELPFSRLAWLKIIGMPVQLRESVVYDKVGELFGKVVKESGFSWIGPDNSTGDCCVLATHMRGIDEEVHVFWEGNQYIVWVKEVDEGGLMPLIDDLKGSSRCSPESSMKSCNAGVEFEEGEVTPENLTGIRQASKDGQKLHGEGGNSAHGRQEKLVSTLADGHKELEARDMSNIQNINNGLLVDTFHMGHGINNNQSSSGRPKKRKRGPARRDNNDEHMSCTSFPDLNTPCFLPNNLNQRTMGEAGSEIRCGGSESAGNEEIRAEGGDDRVEQTAEEAAELDRGGGLDDEVSQTVEAGLKVGIGLTNYEEQVEKLVMEDGGYEGAQ